MHLKEKARLPQTEAIKRDDRSITMQMICLRDIDYLDADELAPRKAKEALLRDENGFLLYLSKERSSASNEERIFRLGMREALIWLNESGINQGSFWA
jgi:hypothetical protein